MSSAAAKAFKLVPVAVFQRLIKLQQQHDGSTPLAGGRKEEQQAAKGEPVATVDDDEEERQQSVDAIVDLLPKSVRRRARIILGNESVKFQSKSLRVVYDGSNGEPPAVGSHLLGDSSCLNV